MVTDGGGKGLRAVRCTDHGDCYLVFPLLVWSHLYLSLFGIFHSYSCSCHWEALSLGQSIILYLYIQLALFCLERL